MLITSSGGFSSLAMQLPTSGTLLLKGWMIGCRMGKEPGMHDVSFMDDYHLKN
jgi:hypothetical protein